MNELIRVELSDNQEPVVSARMLHEYLESKERFSKWFEKVCEYGFVEEEDFTSVPFGTVVNNGAIRDIGDYALKLDMAKEACMVSKLEKGKQARKYFMQVEKDWNSPEKLMARALKMADAKIKLLEVKIEEQAPKVLFADAVATSKTSILIGDLAKIIKQNGFDIGQKRLFAWLRENGYLIKRYGADYNSPTQKSMEMKLFEIKETAITHSDGHVTISKTTKVTGRGQQYFVNIFLGQIESIEEAE